MDERNKTAYFNPRSPCGERHSPRHRRRRREQFQSTLPLRGATAATRCFASSAAPFQSTLPLRGATMPHLGVIAPAGRFQSTLPLRGATEWLRPPSVAGLCISIHAPLAGSDGSQILFAGLDDPEFQSTLPLRGATIQDNFAEQWARGISIHAPLAGSDQCRAEIGLKVMNFNPRSPCGERLPSASASSPATRGISIHAPLAGSDLITWASTEAAARISIHAPLAGSDFSLHISDKRVDISIHAPLAGSDCGTDKFTPWSRANLSIPLYYIK